MLLLLSAVAGGLDAIAFLHIGGVFVCNQTGNVLLVAMSVAGTGATNAIAGASSLLCFIAAAALGGRLLPELRPGDRLPARTALGIGTEVALIGASALLWSRGAPQAAAVAPLALAMGMQAALARRLALDHLTTGYVTGVMAAASITSPAGDRSNPWWWYGIVPVVVIGVSAAAVSVVARRTVVGALAVTAAMATGAWWLGRSTKGGVLAATDLGS